MSQATVEGGASLLNITSGGDVSIHSSSSSVMAEMLQENIEDARSLVTINAAGSVSITADSNAGILLVNQVVAAGWHGSPESRTG